VDELLVVRTELGLDAIDTQRLDLAGDIQCAGVQRVTEAVADVTADHLTTALHHESGVDAGVASDDDRAALLVNTGATADMSLDHDVPAAQRSAGQRAGVLLDHDDTGHHVLPERPSRASLHLHFGAIE